MKRYAIIVAGGHGLRLGGEIPKQFLCIKNRPVLFYTIEKFLDTTDEIILVLPVTHVEYWKKLCGEHNFHPPVVIVQGGDSRAISVKNGLKAIPGSGLVAIHDAVRPFVSRDLINRLFEETAQHGNAIPVIPVRESLRVKQNTESRSVNREDYWVVQTPQCFDFQLINKAYSTAGDNVFTDDAGVYEFAGGKINLVMGETRNIKITYKEDIALAEAAMDATNL